MIESTATTSADLLLRDADFPDNYIHMQHPDDYIDVIHPFIEYIPHLSGHNNRLIVRICWKINDSFVPMSFVCDTGAPMGLYLSEKAYIVLKTRIREDDLGHQYVHIDTIGKSSIESTPLGHAPANIIGLRLLMKLKLEMVENGFSFRNTPYVW